MKAITVYQANDGSRWDDEADAISRDDELAAVDAIMSQLVPMPEDPDCSFANGAGYIQQDGETIRRVRAQLIEITRPLLAWYLDKPENKGIDLSTASPFWICRFVEQNCPITDKGWWRLGRIDDRGREWGQPFYARETPKNPQPFTGQSKTYD